jgi:hypothetical protein
MEKDHGVRFSDEMYATKDEVKRALNISNIDSIWEKINVYRSYYMKQTPLRNVERVPFSVVLPPRLQTEVIKLEKKLSKLLIKYSRHGTNGTNLIKEFDKKEYLYILRTLSRINEIKVGDDTLKAIVDETLPNVPVEYLVLSNYYKTLKYFKTRYAGQINTSLLISLYCKLINREFDPTDFSQYFRKTELIEKSDHVFLGRHYEAAPVDRIYELVDSLCDFLNNSQFFGTINAIIAYFYIIYIKPFEDFNEEIAILLMKYVLAHYDNEDIATFLPLEELLQKEREKYLRSVNLESEMRLDLTYTINYVVEVLQELVAQVEDDVNEIDSLLVYQEQRQDDFSSVNQVTRTEVVNSPSENTIKKEENFSSEETLPSYSVERKVALPVLPVGLDENDAEMVAQHLIELYPTMKRNQAEFYARHCTVGKYYTISQYKKEQNVAYETARTSMDNLVNLGFYKKENIRNKFVYTPTMKED